MTCALSSLAGQFKSGRGLSGVKIASITKFSFSGCVGPAGIMFTVRTAASKTHPWKLNAKSYDMANGETTGAVTGVIASWSGFGCTVTISAAKPTTPGSLEGQYANGDHKLKLVASGSNLHLHNVSAGCLGLWNDGDRLTINGTYAVAPAQTITSP